VVVSVVWLLRRIFGPKWDEITGEWGRIHEEELCDFWFSPNIIRVIKSGRVRWAEHVARIRRRDVHTGGNLRKEQDRDSGFGSRWKNF
jgi:hypothetical protein